MVVEFIGATLGLEERLLRYFGPAFEWEFRFVDTPPPDVCGWKRSVDVIVAPAELFLAKTQSFCAAQRPVVVHGARDHLSACFLSGCSDYLREPFGADELFHRVAAALPRARFQWLGMPVVLEVAGVRCGERLQPLRFAEQRILQTLLRNCGVPVAREALHRTFSHRELGASRVIDVHVSNLRRKLDHLVQHASPSIAASQLQAIRGLGYRFGPCE